MTDSSPPPPYRGVHGAFRACLDLAFRPGRLFDPARPTPPLRWTLLAAWAAGVALAWDRLDHDLFGASIGQARPGWESLAPLLTGSWWTAWPILLLAGAIGGVLIWAVGGWWFLVRLRWAGASGLPATDARWVYLAGGALVAVPALVGRLVDTFRFPDYQTAWSAWASDPGWGWLGWLALPLWSCLVLFRAARTRYSVRPWVALTLLVVLPSAFYLVQLLLQLIWLDLMADEPLMFALLSATGRGIL